MAQLSSHFIVSGEIELLEVTGERPLHLRVLDLTAQIYKQATTQIPTAKLNKAFEIIKAESDGTTRRKKIGWPKIYYATQLAVSPVTILMFVNRPELFEENYMRFIKAKIQKLLPIEEVPIRLLVRKHRTD